MRDYVLAILLFASLPVSLARPFFGALVFAWLSLMNPHRLSWSFAMNMPFAQLTALATLAGALLTSDRYFSDGIRRAKILLTYLAWMCITTLFALNQDAALPKLVEFAKTMLMCVVTLAFLTTPRRVEILAVVATMSIAFYGIKGGYFTIMSGGNFRVWGPDGTAIADNNQLATALVMTIPLQYWIAMRVKAGWARALLAGGILLTAISVFGSQSRGSFLALTAMGSFLLMKSRRKFQTAVLVGAMAIASIAIMPQGYWDRISSISEYEEDGSAQGRLQMWETAVNVANGRPTGGGFDMYVGNAAQQYAVGKLRAPHSIYFQSLGEQGWIGLVLFVMFWIATWRASQRLLRAIPDSPEHSSVRQLLRMIQVSIVGYAVGGAFVNIGYWDFPYYLGVIVLGIARMQDLGKFSNETVRDRRGGILAARAPNGAARRAGGAVGRAWP